MKVIKTKKRFKTGFQQPKSGFPKKSGFNIPNLKWFTSVYKQPSFYQTPL